MSWTMEKEHGRWKRVPHKVYAAFNRNRNYVRFPLGFLPEFKKKLAEALITDDFVEWSHVPQYAPAKAKYTVKEGRAPFPEQVPLVAFACQELPRTKLIPLQTGGGKTFTSLYSCAQSGHRIGIFVRGMFVSKWVTDLQANLEIDKKRIVKVAGAQQLQSILNLAAAGELDYDAIVFSISTVQNYLNLYEQYGDDIVQLGYAITPEDWFEKMGIGIRLIDEVHLHFHAMYKLDCYTHVPNAISLSATLVNKDPMIKKAYSIIFPPETVADVPELKRYAHAVAVHYQFHHPDKIRVKEYGNTQYSHSALEKSVIKDAKTLGNYLKMVGDIARESFDKKKLPDKKLAVYAATKQMCGILTEYFSDMYPALDVRRYVDEDPYENAIDPDIRVSTIGSMGTGVDIPGLTNVVMTTAISSIQSNIQAFGRLREIKGVDVHFHFLTADNVPKHVEYTKEKRDVLLPRSATYGDIYYGRGI